MDETTVPVRLDGEVKGSLTVTAEGLLRRFDARCADPGRLVRLSVYGQGKEGYLGVMEPENGALTLCRKLSRTATAAFPARIEYAAEAGSAAPPRGEAAAAPASRPRSREKDVLWRRVGDGSLYTVSGDRPYRAVPMARLGLPAGKMLERRTIDKSRLREKMGKLPDTVMDRVNGAIAVSFGLRPRIPPQ